MSDAYVFDSVLVLATDEKRLVKHLLDNYQRVGRVGRPTGNSTDPTKVTISFGLIELREFDIENQEIVMVGWTALEWEDTLLMWDNADFATEEISVDPSQIWVPDIVLANSISKSEPIHNTRVQVTSAGNVKWVDMYKYNFYCKVPTDRMDDDKFDCFLKFTSWSMAERTLDLYNSDRIDTLYYVANRDWELYRNKAKRESDNMPWDSTKKTTQVLYEFTLKRRHKVEEEVISSASKVKAASLLPVLMIVYLFKTAFSS